MNLRNNNNDINYDNDNDNDNKRNSAFRKKYTKQTKVKHNTKTKETIEKNLHYIIEGTGLNENYGPTVSSLHIHFTPDYLLFQHVEVPF